MAKIVLAGRSNCPYFARCELLGDRLAKNLNKFYLHKIVLQPEEWENWLRNTCNERGWIFSKSPIVWRELLDRGGKGVLIGGANDFQEYCKAYYDVESELSTSDMIIISKENEVTKNITDEEEVQFRALRNPIHICITNAASPVCYYLLKTLSSGKALGAKAEITIRLLASSPKDLELIKGTAMEAEDLANGLLRQITICTTQDEAFLNCSYVIMLDNIVKMSEESDKQWLIRNIQLFGNYAKYLNHFAMRSCKVLLCGSGPLSLNATIIALLTPRLYHYNIVILSSLLENQAKSVIGDKLKVNAGGVVDLIVWGNISSKCYFDISQCRVHGYSGAIKGPQWYSVSATTVIYDERWVGKTLPKLVMSRHRKVLEARGGMTGLSAANAITETLQNWSQGSPTRQLFSLGVFSEGWYDVPRGMFFSFPVTMDPKGDINVVQDIAVSNETLQKISECVEEIEKQFQTCFGDSYNEETIVTFLGTTLACSALSVEAINQMSHRKHVSFDMATSSGRMFEPKQSSVGTAGRQMKSLILIPETEMISLPEKTAALELEHRGHGMKAANKTDDTVVQEETDKPAAVDNVDVAHTTDNTDVTQITDIMDVTDTTDNMDVTHTTDNSDILHKTDKKDRPDVTAENKSPEVLDSSDSSRSTDSSGSPGVAENKANLSVADNSGTPQIAENTDSPRVDENTDSPRVDETNSSPNVSEAKDDTPLS